MTQSARPASVSSISFVLSMRSGQYAADRDGGDAGDAEAHQDQAQLPYAGVAQDQEWECDHVELVADQGRELAGEQERVVSVPQGTEQRRYPLDERLGRGRGVVGSSWIV